MLLISIYEITKVDLITIEHHELAKRAKDSVAALVFISFIIVVVVVWLLILLNQ